MMFLLVIRSLFPYFPSLSPSQISYAASPLPNGLTHKFSIIYRAPPINGILHEGHLWPRGRVHAT